MGIWNRFGEELDAAHGYHDDGQNHRSGQPGIQHRYKHKFGQHNYKDGDIWRRFQHDLDDAHHQDHDADSKGKATEHGDKDSAQVKNKGGVHFDDHGHSNSGASTHL